MFAEKYADALFEIAVKQQKLDEYAEEFDRFYSLVKDNPKWIELMDSPILRKDKKRKMIFELPSFSPMFLQFLSTIAENGHIKFYQNIYDKWLSLTSAEQKIAHVTLYTATKPTKKKLDSLKEEIKPYFPDLTIKFDVIIDKSLIKGIKIVYQGKSIDRSVKNQLRKLESSI
ncbi:F-ATPase subunit delta [Alteracholeplasma palmae J233]|uniref:ATP synthase subunit delta n=1 Tax=Alteracholeplasma palmae (strain ATCC 49389 / J233) TaxID=1318466 RepID=U4KLP7_ALTPJ|nr:ATP synthase F1 subunit delta [Alteracholeplasma palmae]CCV64813.1 F-ATPase subunit delta [Alteracholeplasma palmae J233]